MIDKTCSKGEPCQYRFQNGAFWGCNYEGYCDFQLPRDSRMQPFYSTLPDLKCNGNYKRSPNE